MVKLLVELLEILRSCMPLFFTLGVWVLFFTLLSKSIKKHATIYYTVFSLPFFLFLIPFLGRYMGITTYNATAIPVVGEIVRDYIHVGALAHPILIIIMYIGALSSKNTIVRRLFSIRKEISIISGFPILTHSLVRVMNNFPNSLKYFTNNAEYMENARYTSELGLGISNFSFVFGIVLLILFIPLWVTSFDSVHRKMGSVKWKKLQKWSYVLYACLFIHAMGIQIGGILNPRGGAPRPNVQATAQVQGGAENARPATDSIVVSTEGRSSGERERGEGRPSREERSSGERERGEGRPSSGQAAGGQTPAAGQAPSGQTPAAGQASGGRVMPKSLTEVLSVSRQARQYIHVVSLILIYGSYLYLRLRKAKRSRERRNSLG